MTSFYTYLPESAATARALCRGCPFLRSRHLHRRKNTLRMCTLRLSGRILLHYMVSLYTFMTPSACALAQHALHGYFHRPQKGKTQTFL